MRALIIPVITTFSFAFSSYAGDVGTYRPGNIYLSIPAQSPEQCANQCSGDAQCKSWNFVTVRQNQAVCEFNARKSEPIASAVSISGDNPSAIDSARLIPTGHRTTRLGHSSAPRFVSRPGNVTRVGAVPAAQPPAIQHRQRITQPIPQQAQSIAVVHRPPVQSTSPALAQPGFRHSLDMSQNAAPVRTVQRPNIQSSNAQRPASRSPFARRVPANNPLPNAGGTITNNAAESEFAPMLEAASQSRIEQNPMAPVPPRSAAAPARPDMPSLSDIPQNILAPSIDSALAGGPLNRPAPRGDALYGSLFDDVKAPRGLTADDIPMDPDAPIPTVTSVPIERLDVAPF